MLHPPPICRPVVKHVRVDFFILLPLSSFIIPSYPLAVSPCLRFVNDDSDGFRHPITTHALRQYAAVVVFAHSPHVCTAKVFRLLGVLRLWRVVRLINSVIGTIERAHETTKIRLLDEKRVRLGLPFPSPAHCYHCV